jgi:hypothetical protein
MISLLISCWKTKLSTTTIWKVEHNIEAFIEDGAGMCKAGKEAHNEFSHQLSENQNNDNKIFGRSNIESFTGDGAGMCEAEDEAYD